MAGFGATPPVSAQGLVDINTLQVASPQECKSLLSRVSKNESGGQWLIGERIPLMGAANARQPMDTLLDAFTPVTCFGKFEFGPRKRVFVADRTGEHCGWVSTDQLLTSYEAPALTTNPNSGGAVCPVAKAMPFNTFCARLTQYKGVNKACEGVPPGLRAKGVLLGSTQEGGDLTYPFFTAPRNGRQLDSRNFFSVLEIYDLAPGLNERLMALVGDGSGDMFGWIDLNAIELWPTRIGLFYDTAGTGRMFQRDRDLRQNWRTNGRSPEADISSGLTRAELAGYIHGDLPLLTYPVVRTVSSEGNPKIPPHHEVIFLGQTGEGSASQLIAQREAAQKIEELNRLNIMLVVDTTESMREYLPLIQDGITRFIREYGQRNLNGVNHMPETRIAVYAYSDFLDKKRMGLNDPIRIKRLMPPSRIGAGFNLSALLKRISSHKGLNDAIGLREEAALEAVLQLSRKFGNESGWFENGPRVIIHIADHGSRPNVSTSSILRGLKQNSTYYYPVAVVTDDKGDKSRTRARTAFFRQAMAMLDPLVEGAVRDSDVATINLTSFRTKTATTVRNALNLVVGEVLQSNLGLRRKIIGDELADASQRALDMASSRIRLDEALLRDRGLDTLQAEVIVQADTAFAPLVLRQQGLETPVNWNYTIALEPEQARFLQDSFSRMCSNVGRPEKRNDMKRLIVRLAEVFSGDTITRQGELDAVFSDLGALPGADRSFLAQIPQQLLQKIDSTSPGVVLQLRKDVCWTSYHLNNMDSQTYATPDKIAWSSRGYALLPGKEVIHRVYKYRPVVGRETVYLPSFFFVLPSVVLKQADSDGGCSFLCD
jgi:hypothetical protein